MIDSRFMPKCKLKLSLPISLHRCEKFLKKMLRSFPYCGIYILLISFTHFYFSITFFLATGLTALSFVLERKQGLLDRSYAAGNGEVPLYDLGVHASLKRS